MIPSDYEQRVYAGWLGKCIGVRFGAPVENWTYDQIYAHIGEITDYLPIPEGKIFQPDDDTSVPLVLLRAVEDFGPDFTPQQVGQTLLNYLGDQHGSLWWGGYGVSTEHTAYLNLKAGIPAPVSGSAVLNGKSLSEQIGGQIFSDIWGLLAPGDPARAADYSGRSALVTHAGEGVQGGRFIAALVSAAFTTSQPEALVQAGFQVLDPASEYARMVQAMLDNYRQQPDDWRAGYEYLRANYGYDRYPGIVPIIPNAGVILLGLLYGQGDFSRTICIGNMCGWDTDCNVGNLGAILGVAVGLDGIPERWKTPLNDRIAAASLIGAANLPAISATAHRLASIGARLAGAAELPPALEAGFDLPGATHGFLHWGEQRNILTLRTKTTPSGGALQAVVRLLKKKQDLRLYQETYWDRARLVSDYYAAGFSPTIYPGQSVRARLFLPAGSPAQLMAALYVMDMDGTIYQDRAAQLQPGEWRRLEWRIPPLNDALLAQVGLIFRSLGPETWKGEFLLDDFDWGGRPAWTQNFSKARPEYGAIAGWTYWRGYWRVEQNALLGSGSEGAELYTGLPEWTDLDAALTFTPLLGDQHGLLLRVRGAQRSIFAGLCGTNTVAIIQKSDAGSQTVATAPFPWACGTACTLEARLAGDRLSLAVDGVPRLEWEVPKRTPTGQIGLAAAPGGCTRFETLSIR